MLVKLFSRRAGFSGPKNLPTRKHGFGEQGRTFHNIIMRSSSAIVLVAPESCYRHVQLQYESKIHKYI